MRLKLLLITFLTVFYIEAQEDSSYKLYLDSSKSHIDRLNDLMSRMTLEDKVYQIQLI